MQWENKSQMCMCLWMVRRGCSHPFFWPLALHSPHVASASWGSAASTSSCGRLRAPAASNTHRETQRFHITPTIKTHTILLALLHNGELSISYLEVYIMSRITFAIHVYPKQLKKTFAQFMHSRGIKPKTYCLSYILIFNEFFLMPFYAISFIWHYLIVVEKKEIHSCSSHWCDSKMIKIPLWYHCTMKCFILFL